MVTKEYPKEELYNQYQYPNTASQLYLRLELLDFLNTPTLKGRDRFVSSLITRWDFCTSIQRFISWGSKCMRRPIFTKGIARLRVSPWSR